MSRQDDNQSNQYQNYFRINYQEDFKTKIGTKNKRIKLSKIPLKKTK